MADIDRDTHDRRPDERVYSVNSGGGAAGWWIAGILALAVLIIGFIAMSGGNPAPVDGTDPAAVTETAPMTETAPATETAPMTEPAPAEPAPAAPAGDAAPAEGAAPPAAGETVPAQ